MGLSQPQVAQLTGFSNGYISLLETGRRLSTKTTRPMPKESVLRFAQVLHIPLDELAILAGYKKGEIESGEKQQQYDHVVDRDPLLTREQKQILKSMYRNLVSGAAPPRGR